MKKLKLAEKLKRLSMPVPFSGCWIWLPYVNEFGYGRLRVNNKKTLAPRASWMAFVGEIPEGVKVLHKCDVPACINPQHLFLGTDKDNVRDCISKGRFKGIQNSPFVKGHHLGRYGRAGKPKEIACG